MWKHLCDMLMLLSVCSADKKDPCQGVTACSGLPILLETHSTVNPGLAALAADFEGIGYALADLACLYQGKKMLPRSQGDRLWLGLAAMTDAHMLPPSTISGMYTHVVLGSPV